MSERIDWSQGVVIEVTRGNGLLHHTRGDTRKQQAKNRKVLTMETKMSLMVNVEVMELSR